MVLSKLTDEQQQELFPKGISNKVYYGFLDDFDLNTEETKPLESACDLWLTSTVRRCHRAPAAHHAPPPLPSPPPRLSLTAPPAPILRTPPCSTISGPILP